MVLEEQEQELAHIAVDWVRRLVLDMAVALEQDMAEELEPVHIELDLEHERVLDTVEEQEQGIVVELVVEQVRRLVDRQHGQLELDMALDTVEEQEQVRIESVC